MRHWIDAQTADKMRAAKTAALYGEQNAGADAKCDVRWRIETLEEDKSR